MSQQFARDVSVDGVRGRGENVPLGAVAGLVAGIIGAGVWMAVAVGLNLHVGYVALGVGALVGLAIRVAGNGRSAIFGLMGAIYTLLGCVGGEYLARVQALTSAQHDFYSILTSVDAVQMVTGILTQANPIDYLIYGIGIFEGYKLSIRK
jgi:hypothetical protein